MQQISLFKLKNEAKVCLPQPGKSQEFYDQEQSNLLELCFTWQSHRRDKVDLEYMSPGPLLEGPHF